MIELLKWFALVVAICFTETNLVRGIRGQSIPAVNFIIHSIAIVGFIYLQWFYGH